MPPLPTLTTQRLFLRPFALTDAPEVQRLASAREIADTTRIPHPYPPDGATTWIARHQPAFDEGRGLELAVTLRETGALVGAVGIVSISRENCHAEIGYWVGLPYWRRGYCTEAARAVVQYAFDVMGLHRVTGHHLSRNPASGRVMEKIGMKHEGHLRQHVRKWEKFEDVEVWAVLRSEWKTEGGP